MKTLLTLFMVVVSANAQFNFKDPGFLSGGCTTYTIADPTYFVVEEQVDVSGCHSDQGYTYVYTIYAFKNVGAVRIYSNGVRTEMPDGGFNGDNFYMSLSWDSVPGALGYRVVVNQDFYESIDENDPTYNPAYFDVVGATSVNIGLGGISYVGPPVYSGYTFSSYDVSLKSKCQ